MKTSVCFGVKKRIFLKQIVGLLTKPADIKIWGKQCKCNRGERAFSFARGALGEPARKRFNKLFGWIWALVGPHESPCGPRAAGRMISKRAKALTGPDLGSRMNLGMKLVLKSLLMRPLVQIWTPESLFALNCVLNVH